MIFLSAAGFGFNYSESKPGNNVTNRSSNLSGNVAFNLTEKWRFSFATSYDIVNSQFTAPYLTAYRDLNSWELNFNWYPAGTYRGFSLEIRIKLRSSGTLKFPKTNSRGVY
ncbi:MAG: hypothetical protein IPJ45_02505 [Ignavibacteria bacterium]|nr:hypothetical protein [Ignavibacteria bacterium]